MIQHTDSFSIFCSVFSSSNPPLLCVDLFLERLAMAKELGADFQLTVKKGDGPKQLAKSVQDMLGVQPHVTIECTGAESSIQTAVYVCDSFKVIKVKI